MFLLPLVHEALGLQYLLWRHFSLNLPEVSLSVSESKPHVSLNRVLRHAEALHVQKT